MADSWALLKLTCARTLMAAIRSGRSVSLEGWYAVQDARRSGIGFPSRRLGRGHGCFEMVSDTWIDNELSQSSHQALGFQIVDWCVHYRKTL